jgi:hypothetical protein
MFASKNAKTSLKANRILILYATRRSQDDRVPSGLFAPLGNSAPGQNLALRPARNSFRRVISKAQSDFRPTRGAWHGECIMPAAK